jgi:hypothetical protein
VLRGNVTGNSDWPSDMARNAESSGLWLPDNAVHRMLHVNYTSTFTGHASTHVQSNWLCVTLVYH